MQRVALVILSDYVFLAVPEGATVFVLLHQPCPRHEAGVAPTPLTYGPTVLRLVLSGQSHMLKVANEREVSYWARRLGECPAPPGELDSTTTSMAELDDHDARGIPSLPPSFD
jgi:hypothetical protein